MSWGKSTPGMACLSILGESPCSVVLVCVVGQLCTLMGDSVHSGAFLCMAGPVSFMGSSVSNGSSLRALRKIWESYSKWLHMSWGLCLHYSITTGSEGICTARVYCDTVLCTMGVECCAVRCVYVVHHSYVIR